jgi:hypothetical protein
MSEEIQKCEHEWRFENTGWDMGCTNEFPGIWEEDQEAYRCIKCHMLKVCCKGKIVKPAKIAGEMPVIETYYDEVIYD